MDCGVPFCHTGELIGRLASGCPVNNLIPEWNDLVYRGQWREALDRLHQTNNFPEFTGRVCPAPCEGSCVLGINEPPVTIKNIERTIIDRGFENGWVVPESPATRTGKNSCRHRLRTSRSCRGRSTEPSRSSGHRFRTRRPDRWIVDVRHPQHEAGQRASCNGASICLAAEGNRIQDQRRSRRRHFRGRNQRRSFDAIVICVGATLPRDLKIPGRSLKGIHFAMDFLTESTSCLLVG